jgi:glycosyltransferase involved in cell wall biosynthesis
VENIGARPFDSSGKSGLFAAGANDQDTALGAVRRAKTGRTPFFNHLMNVPEKPIRVLYSFPHKLGADRICYTAWNQVNGLAEAGAEVLAFPGVLHRPVADSVKIWPTMAWGKLRVSYKLLGTMRACALHDYIVARRIEKLVGKIDLIHGWCLGSLRTFRTARRLGIPTFIERANVHTRFVYEAVQKECDRIGVLLPHNHEYAFKAKVLAKEELEYDAADYLLCPSDFVAKTFRDNHVPERKLIRHIYGFDEKRFFPDAAPRDNKRGLTVIFVGVCAVLKGLHFALEAWLRSPASRDGTFLIAGKFIPQYAEKLAPMLAHPSVKRLGQRNDVPELMRNSDILLFPTIAEGFGLVVAEAIGSGCVPLVSDACTDIVRDGANGFVHHVADVGRLSEQITQLHENRNLLQAMRQACLADAPGLTWTAAGRRLLHAYCTALDGSAKRLPSSQ